jgi:polyisoprenoid-binding protein YceI
MRRPITAACFAIMAAAAPSFTEEIRVELDPAATSITFELGATLHTVHGTAELQRGRFVVDTETGETSGEAVVAAASADTGNNKRDRKMHSKVLLSRDHPSITVRAEKLEEDLSLDGESEVTLVGTMELLGATHPIRIPMTVSIDGASAVVEATWSIPYVDWGLEDPSTFVLRVDKEVAVTVRATDVAVSVGSSR